MRSSKLTCERVWLTVTLRPEMSAVDLGVIRNPLTLTTVGALTILSEDTPVSYLSVIYGDSLWRFGRNGGKEGRKQVTGFWGDQEHSTLLWLLHGASRAAHKTADAANLDPISLRRSTLGWEGQSWDGVGFSLPEKRWSIFLFSVPFLSTTQWLICSKMSLKCGCYEVSSFKAVYLNTPPQGRPRWMESNSTGLCVHSPITWCLALLASLQTTWS